MHLNNKPQKEVHLFIIWEHARTIEEKIIEDISKKFSILKVYEVHWSKEKFSENLSRFYGTQLPPKSRKEVHVGTNPFLAVIVEDKKPTYKTHTTSKGDKHVNTNLFTTKALHREWTGGGHKIHASNTLAESDHNLTLLFGVNTSDFLKKYVSKPSKKICLWEKDLVGSNGWESIGQLFYVLNNTIDYVVLRNFEMLPDDYYAEDHGDIDLLVSNYKDACFVTNSRPVFRSKDRAFNSVTIAKQNVFFDFRHTGDGYYDSNWQESILANRQLSAKGFYIPSAEHYYYSLLYHALIHKPKLGQDYIKKLTSLKEAKTPLDNTKTFTTSKAVEHLSKFLVKKSYAYTQPADKSAYFHMGHIRTGAKYGTDFKRRKMIPIRNYFKSKNIPFKHYLLKARKIIRRYTHKLKP